MVVVACYVMRICKYINIVCIDVLICFIVFCVRTHADKYNNSGIYLMKY
jgi:hypothetical protein